MALTKVSGGILDPGINVAGIVTATGFSGPFIGGGGINAGILTATGLDVNGNGDISGNLVIGGNLTANGDFTTLNTTLREVELLRVDAQDNTVTAGIITQRGTGNILDLYDTSSAVFSVRDGGNIIMGASAGSITPHAPLHIRTATTGAITSLLKLHGPFTSNTGSEGTAIDFGTAADTSTGARIIGSREAAGAKGALRFCTGRENDSGFNDGRMVIDETGNVGIGSAAPTAKLDVRGGSHIYGDGQAAVEWGNTAYAGHLSYDASNNPVIRSATGKALIFHTNSGNERMRIKSDGTVLINNERNITHSSLCIDKPDAGSATLKFKNNGSDHGYIQLTNGEDLHYYLPTSSTTSDHVFYTAGQQRVIMLGTGYVGIGTGNPSALLDVNKGTQANIQLKTTQAGSINSMSFAIGSSTNQIFSRGANSSTPRNFIIGMGSTEVVRIDTTGNIILKDTAAQGNSLVHYIKATDVNGASQYQLGMVSTGNQDLYLQQTKNANLRFQTNGSTRWKIDGDPGHLLPETAGSVNIGSATAEIGDVYIADDKRFYAGSDQNLSLYHNNSTGINYLVSNPGNMFYMSSTNYFTDAAQSKIQAQFIHNSYCELRHAGNLKFQTSETGIDVTGEVAASQDYPNFRPTLNFNFVANSRMDPRISYSRTGPASFLNENGKIELVGSDAPRIDHDPSTRECKGLLIEESRTNYVRVSTNLASQWIAGGGSFAVDNAITNPDGSVGAYYHTGAELYHQDIDLSGASTNVITVSLWVKERSGQSGNLDIEIFQQITGSVISMGVWSFNPATEVISTVPSTYSDGKVVEYPNGWYRVSAKATTASGNFSSTTRFDMQSSEHYVWGMQIEVGAFPTSFIPTNGSTATRGVDITTIDGDEFTEFYNDDEWTMVTHTNVDNSQSLVASPATANSINFEGDAISKKFQTRYVTSTTNNQGYVDVIGNMSGTTYYDLTGGGVGNYNMKTAHAAKVNDVAVSFNGGTVQTDSSVTMLTNPTRMNIGENPKQCHIKRIMYYPKRLPNSQLVTLTS